MGAIASGAEDLPSVRAALVPLEQKREGLEAELAAMTARVAAPDTTEATINDLIASLSRSREVIEAGDPEERKALVRTFLGGIEIRKATRQAVLSWYRVPDPDQLSVKLVAPTGFDGATCFPEVDFEGIGLAA